MDLAVAIATFILENGIPHLPYSKRQKMACIFISINMVLLNLVVILSVNSHVTAKDSVVQFSMCLVRNEGEKI